MMLRIEFTHELTRRCSSNFTLAGEVFLRTLPPSMSNRVPPGQHESAKEGSARPQDANERAWLNADATQPLRNVRYLDG